MSSKRNVLQEFQFAAETSRSRKKIAIDGFKPLEATKDATLQREEGKEPDGFESKYDLRKSLAWDSAFFTNPGVLDPEELFETLNFHDGDNGVSQSDCLGSSRIGECIARRSLAWDAAFFTSAGVLDQEELSMMNKGYKKSETQTRMLPGIEELLKSADSNYTFISDYPLASLELDLFDDMRASMQKSTTTSNFVNPNCNLECQASKQQQHSSKRVDPSKVQIKPLPPFKRQTISGKGFGKTVKKSVNLPRPQVAARCEASNTSSCRKLSQRFSQANTPSMAATKSASLCANQNNVRKPASESISSHSYMNLRECARSGCSQSTSIVKTPLGRKNDLTASDPSFKTPSRSLTRSKNKLLDSTQPIHFPSTLNSSSSICWSSETSTSGNHVSKKSSTRLRNTITRKASFNSDASSQGSDTDNRSSDQHFVGNGSKKTRLEYQDVDRISKGSSPLPPAAPRETKPSGLRMPSPKIGFFDLGNSTRPLTPNGGLKFHSGRQSSSNTKSGLHHPNGTANRSRNGNVQSPRTLTRSGSMKERKPISRQARNPEVTFSQTIPSSLAPTWKSEIGLKEAIGKQVVKKSCLNQNEDTNGHNVENQIQSEKENFSFQNQVDALSKQIEAFDLKGDLVLEL